jgi:hypothetical protein
MPAPPPAGGCGALGPEGVSDGAGAAAVGAAFSAIARSSVVTCVRAVRARSVSPTRK